MTLGLTLTYFTARSTLVAHTSELLNCHLKRKKLAGNGQMDKLFMILKNHLPKGLF